MPKSSVKSAKSGYMLTLTKADKFSHRKKRLMPDWAKRAIKEQSLRIIKRKTAELRRFTLCHDVSFSLKAQFLSLKAHPLIEVLLKL